jgi:hypothetical protein
MLPSSEVSPTMMSQLRVDLLTLTPWRCTTSGRDAMASWSLFCTWAQARSGSVPGAKVSSTRPAPEASLLADMYSILSNPVIFCSMIWTTLFSTVSAEAPG